MDVQLQEMLLHGDISAAVKRFLAMMDEWETEQILQHFSDVFPKDVWRQLLEVEVENQGGSVTWR